MRRLLLAPLRFALRAASIVRKAHATPSGWVLLRAWLSLNLRPERSRKEELSIPLGGGRRLYGRNWDELDFLFDEIFLADEYFVDLPSSSPVILDCGANIGSATVYLKLRFPGATITAFEPNPSCVRMLERNVSQNGFTGVTIIPAGCGRSSGVASLNFDTRFSVSGSLNATRSEFTEAVDVALVKLSDYITTTIDLLKLDVEGAEWEVIADLRESGKLAVVDRMIIEYHHLAGGETSRFGEFLSMLESEGFEYAVGAPLRPGKRFAGVFQDIMVYAERRRGA
jgi:FkbM family methyltransferase